MKIAVLADIHGNFPALNAVLAEIKDEGVTKILVAGDILGGPYPVEVIRRFQYYNIIHKNNFPLFLLFNHYFFVIGLSGTPTPIR